MTASVANLQAQVESVLGALVKAATLELTKLFESRYRDSAPDADAGRVEVRRRNGATEALDASAAADSKRSIGVQVDEGVCPQQELCGGCSGSFTRSDFLLTVYGWSARSDT